MSNDATKNKHCRLIIIKALVVVSIISLSSKLSKINVDRTTLARSNRTTPASTEEVKNDSYSDNDFTRAELFTAVSQLNVPIFLMDPISKKISVMEWQSIVQQWGRNTTYNDILQSNQTIEDAIIPLQKNKQVLVFHHLMPKTASSTLRQACQDTQFETCGIEPKGPGNKRPDGYMAANRLIEVMNSCPQTRHYCVMANTQPLTASYTQFHAKHTFLHLFPFRNYDEWVISALRQVYYRDGEEGCLEENILLDQCKPHKYELDIAKYPKASISYFLHSWKRMKKTRLGFEDHHMMLMYDYRYLHETLDSLNKKYRTPLLEGTDAKKNSDRPEGTCKDDVNMLKKFHECFSEELDNLK